MINAENEIFDKCQEAVKAVYPNSYITGEYVKSPPKFPCASIVEMDNTVYEQTITSSDTENHAQLLYQVDVYSNKQKGKKTECKEIIAIIDNVMLSFGFIRTMLQPIPNMDDATIYRMTGRYVAIISKNKTIYRR